MNKPAVRFRPVAPVLMKYIIIITIFFISLELMAKKISELNWEKRTLIISYENKNNDLFTKTEKFISDYKCEVNARNLEIIFFEKFIVSLANVVDKSTIIVFSEAF